MTIEKGQSWGEPAGPDLEPAVAADDAELARLALVGHRDGVPVVATVATGDLRATLGVTDDRPVGERYVFPIDLGLATFDLDTNPQAAPVPFVAHLIVGAPGFPGAELLGRVLGHGPPISVAVMNAAWLGDLRLGPRAHPNDGRLDIIEGRVEFRQRRESHRRAKAGAHLPHPDLQATRAASWEGRFDRPQPVTVDGVDRGHSSSILVEVIPDAVLVVV